MGNTGETPRTSIEVLQKELERVQAKAAATDAAFMSYLSIGVTPFLIFTAYAVAERRYQIFLIALPVLTVLGLAVVAVLGTHYSYATAYSAYLERRINYLLGCDELRDAEFADCAYRSSFSPVVVSYVVALFALLALNVIAIPAINEFRCRFEDERPHAPVILKLAVRRYWLAVGPFVAIAGALLLCSAVHTSRNLKRTAEAATSLLQRDGETDTERPPADVPP